MNALLEQIKPQTNTHTEIEGYLNELVWLTSQYEFSEREFNAAGVNVEILKKWLLGLTLLTDGG